MNVKFERLLMSNIDLGMCGAKLLTTQFLNNFLNPIHRKIRELAPIIFFMRKKPFQTITDKPSKL